MERDRFRTACQTGKSYEYRVFIAYRRSNPRSQAPRPTPSHPTSRPPFARGPSQLPRPA
jgi:hypothetical protein